MLPGPLQTLLWAVGPRRFAETCRRRHGPIFTTNMYPFGQVIYVCAPEEIHRILTTDAHLFPAGAANKVIEFVAGPRSLLMLDGGEHAAPRRKLTPPFHGANVGHFVELMQRVVEQEVGGWREREVVRLQGPLQRISLEVMIQAVFGVTDSRRIDRLRFLVPELLRTNPAIALIPFLRRDFGGRGPWARFTRLRREVDEVIYAEIADRRAAGASDRRDALSMLLGGDAEISDDELRDHLVTILAVGHETTATETAWFFERVLRHPGTFERVLDAVALEEWRYLDAAINETMRTRPVTMDIARVLAQPGEVGGYRFPTGTMFALSLAMLHTSPELYPEPDRFRPERFLDAGPSRGSFLPFGGGSHRCLGASLAMVEMRTIISTILRNVDLAVARPAPERPRPRGPMLVPHREAEVMVVRNRLRSGAGVA